MTSPPTLVWLRRDLRVADNPALAAAAQDGPVLPVFILDPADRWAPGGAARWWLHHSLARLENAIAARGGRLAFGLGPPAAELPRLALATGARRVLWNRGLDPRAPEQEAAVAAALAAHSIDSAGFPADLLAQPGTVRSRSGGSFQVFTAFWRAWRALPPPPTPLPAPARLAAPAEPPSGPTLADLDLLPRPRWWDGLAEIWQPGEDAAAQRLAAFLDAGVAAYATRRDQPGEDGTSRLSPHLAFGEIGPRQIWHAATTREPSQGAETFLREVGWRDFSHALLADHPDLPDRPLRPEFAAFPWDPPPGALAAWQRGETGFPIVDAGMRQLWRTGWMHNRVRMIVASFLVKDLLTPWQTGEAWFWDTLVDASPAVNAASWQWVAGCGADAAPYFRVFNPVLQGEKFDPRGRYVRRWLPELAGLPDRWVHRPWEAEPLALAAAGIALDRTYPRPILDHGAARQRALAAFAGLRVARGGSAPPA